MAATENRNRSVSLAAVLVAAWAIVALIAFFANRGEDAGRIGSLFKNLGGGSVAGSGIFGSLAGVAVAVLIAVSWYGLGSMIFRYMRVSSIESDSSSLGTVFRIAIGASAWSVIWLFLGLFGLYTPVVALAALAAGLLLAAFSLMKIRAERLEPIARSSWTNLDRAFVFLIAIPVVLAFVGSLAPPIAKDTLLYHFAVPKAFVAQGSNGFIEGNIASYLALGTEMHVVWAMLGGGWFSERAAEAAAGAAIWMFYPLLLVTIFGFARNSGLQRRWALIAVLMTASVPTAYHVASSAYIDLALSLFVTLAIYSLTQWWKTLEPGWMVAVAIFLGAALASKLTALFVIAAFAIVVLLRVRTAQDRVTERMGKIAGVGFASLMLAGVLAAPSYIRTWAETGSPIFPFYMNIWAGKAPGWDVERSNLFQAMNAQYGGYTKTPLDYLASPWNLSVSAQPEIATHFDGVLGAAFLIGLPILIWALWKFDMPAEVKISVGIAAIMFFFWLFSSQQLRYLLPILPVLAIGIAASFEKIGDSVGGTREIGLASLGLAAAAGILVSAAWFMQKAPVRVVLGGESRDEYLARAIDYYPYYQWLNTESAEDARVWLINMRRDTYNLERPYFSDYLFEDWTLRKMVWESRSSEELKAKTAAMNVQYILARHDFLFDYDRSPLVDDSKPRAENEAKIKMSKELLLDTARTIRSDKKFSLVKVF